VVHWTKMVKIYFYVYLNESPLNFAQNCWINELPLIWYQWNSFFNGSRLKIMIFFNGIQEYKYFFIGTALPNSMNGNFFCIKVRVQNTQNVIANRMSMQNRYTILCDTSDFLLWTYIIRLSYSWKNKSTSIQYSKWLWCED
jgi:hypothetical protein